jgi:hypothetical protein
MAEWPYNTSRWKKLRLAKLSEQPLCEICHRRGRDEEAIVVDHFLAIRHGGHPFPELTGLLSLCIDCHNEKTSSWDRPGPSAFRRRFDGCDAKGNPVDPWDGWATGSFAAPSPSRKYSIPPGLKPSAIPVVLVAGPPGAGKTTYAHANPQPRDLVIDLDDYLVRAGGQRWGWDDDRKIIDRAYRLRNLALASLADPQHDRAFLIASAPQLAEREAWARALVQVETVVLAVPADECKRRILADPQRDRHAARQCRVVDDWWRAYSGREGAFKDGKRPSPRPMCATNADLIRDGG